VKKVIITKGAYSPKLITRADGPFDFQDKKAAHLVKIGIAEYYNPPPDVPEPGDTEDPDAPPALEPEEPVP